MESLTAEKLTTLATLFGLTLVVVRWFHRSAKNEIVRKLVEELDSSDERSFGSRINAIQSDVTGIKQRMDRAERRLAIVEGGRPDE